MKSFLLAAILTFAAPQIAHAKSMPTLDMDALLFSSELVVEGPIVAQYLTTYKQHKITLLEGADVKVEKTLVGDDCNGKIVALGDVSLYRKGQMWIRYSKLEKQVINGKTQMVYVTLPAAQQPKMTQLEKGDRAIFFLQKAPRQLNDSIRRADFWVLASGVRLVRQNQNQEQVSGFSQMSNPGPYGETRGTSRAIFDAGFAASVARVSELKSKLAAPPNLADVAFFQSWAKRRKDAKTRSYWRGSDVILKAVETQLAAIEALNR